MKFSTAFVALSLVISCFVPSEQATASRSKQLQILLKRDKVKYTGLTMQELQLREQLQLTFQRPQNKYRDSKIVIIKKKLNQLTRRRKELRDEISRLSVMERIESKQRKAKGHHQLLDRHTK